MPGMSSGTSSESTPASGPRDKRGEDDMKESVAMERWSGRGEEKQCLPGLIEYENAYKISIFQPGLGVINCTSMVRLPKGREGDEEYRIYRTHIAVEGSGEKEWAGPPKPYMYVH